jgi:hypothetical protein
MQIRGIQIIVIGDSDSGLGSSSVKSLMLAV